MTRSYVVFICLHPPPWSVGTPASLFSSLQHAATRCNTLQHAATRCNTLQHTAKHYFLSHLLAPGNPFCVHLYQRHSRCCNTLQHTTTYCNTLRHTATHCNSLHHKSGILIAVPLRVPYSSPFSLLPPPLAHRTQTLLHAARIRDSHNHLRLQAP